ncbi:hypothetical protein [Nostoc piscinale]|uniref:hypothetical protein n=1 Tax=Nostoc piscinale TaxID=224012 RepID=UPI000B2762AE
MNPASSSRVQGELKLSQQKQSNILAVIIIKLLNLVTGDTDLAAEFIQLWTIQEFQLGDDLTKYLENTATSGNSNFFLLGMSR